MEKECPRCGKIYNDIFETKVRADYTEPGRGKPYEWDICLDCRKELIEWFEGGKV